ncbi:zinc finger MYM-type protein 1 [Trichonephila clavata]|uniref:Zinc finger MYM-type protein 1 n=1 Tax=Trichonephila clavata TaxID=2740835 RepID=A0A8X6FIK2_TRICU|nr:zinc finger MYM-type protein 1 [Trichonephila clavata]
MGPFPKDIHQNNWCFSKSYHCFLQYWLCFFPKLDVAYCKPNWLFGSQKNNVWCTGIRDWRHLSMRIKQHSFSSGHVEVCAVYERWEKMILSTRNIKMKFTKKRHLRKWFFKDNLISYLHYQRVLWLSRLVKVIEKSHEGYQGNFLSFVVLVARYDHILRQV